MTTVALFSGQPAVGVVDRRCLVATPSDPLQMNATARAMLLWTALSQWPSTACILGHSYPRKVFSNRSPLTWGWRLPIIPAKTPRLHCSQKLCLPNPPSFQLLFTDLHCNLKDFLAFTLVHSPGAITGISQINLLHI